MTEIERVSVLAREAGMSYGKYIATHTVPKRGRTGTAVPVVGSRYVCQDCGAGMDHLVNSGRRKYCEACAKARRNLKNARCYARWAARHANE